jgi:hypothetical protein
LARALLGKEILVVLNFLLLLEFSVTLMEQLRCEKIKNDCLVFGQVYGKYDMRLKGSRRPAEQRPEGYKRPFGKCPKSTIELPDNAVTAL